MEPMAQRPHGDFPKLYETGADPVGLPHFHHHVAAYFELVRADATMLRPLRIGVANHVGPVIVGEMGYGQARGLTAIGDTVNTASRFEALNKRYGSQLILSEAVAARAGLDLGTVPRYRVEICGRTTPVTIRAVATLGELAPILRADRVSPAPGGADR